MFLACLVFNLKALEFRAFLPISTVFGTLKWYDVFQICAKTFIFDKPSDKKKNLSKIALQVSKIAFSPMAMP